MIVDGANRGIIRPVMSRVLPSITNELEPVAMGELSLEDLGLGGEEGADGLPGALGQGGTAAISAPKQSVAESLDQMLEVRDVDGKVRASSIRKLGRIVEQYPEEVVAILRTWIYEQENAA